MKKKVKNKKNSILKKYYELLYAVSEKYPGDTRHETALRYIKSYGLNYCGGETSEDNEITKKPMDE